MASPRGQRYRCPLETSENCLQIVASVCRLRDSQITRIAGPEDDGKQRPSVGHNRELEYRGGGLSGSSSVFSIFFSFLLVHYQWPCTQDSLPEGSPTCCVAMTFNFVLPAMSLRRLYGRQAVYMYIQSLIKSLGDSDFQPQRPGYASSSR